MDKVFKRNYIIFAVVLLTCAAVLSYVLIYSEKRIDSKDDWVVHTHSVIVEAQTLSTLIEGIVASQRGYALTKNEVFLERQKTKKKNISQHIKKLTELTSDNPSQQERLKELSKVFTIFSEKLEEIVTFESLIDNENYISYANEVNELRDQILALNNEILEDEHVLLNERINALEHQKSQYFSSLLVSVIVGTLLLLIFNGFLLSAQFKRTRAETSLSSAEKRFKLAIEGTQEGVFDWNIDAGEVYYSQRFFSMLGMKNKATTGTTDNFKNLLHPDDAERVWAHAEQYLNNELSEYKQEFRMKHESGRWVWIQARGKAIRDEEGRAIRMVGTHTDITAIVNAQEKLEQEKEVALDSNRAKSEFLAHMSHEIRTPLTAISGIAEILNNQKDDFNDKQAQLVKTLGSSTASLKELINDILDFSKIESGELELEEIVFPLETIFEETISMMSVKANEKEIRFVFDYDDIKDKDFYGDGKRIRQILVNLVGNAIKFTDKGTVTVKAVFEERNGADFLRLVISDTGVGIDTENFDLIFERFKQADASVSRKYGGTGLGLPISRKLAHLMGGEIFISSQKGEGSTFSVILPLKRVDGENDKGHATNAKKLNDKIIARLNDNSKVLLVEDYEGNVVVIGYMLEDLGIEYDVAVNGVEALELWQNNHYDIVLMDVQMPEMDGFTATSKIRKIEKKDNLDRTPVIGMTAHALVGDKDKCIEAGMDSYLPKPLVEADLKREILKYLENKTLAA